MEPNFTILTIYDKLPKVLNEMLIKKLEELDWDLIVNYNQYNEMEICIPINKINELYFK